MVNNVGRLIVRHWRGEYTVERSFLLHYVLFLPILLACLFQCVAWTEFRSEFITCAVVIQSCAWIWALIGVFRSSMVERGSEITGSIIVIFLMVNILAAMAALFLWWQMDHGMFGGNGYR